MKNIINIKILLLLLLGVLYRYNVNAQFVVPGVPYMIHESLGEMPTVTLPYVDNAAEHNNAEALGGTPSCSTCKVKYYAKGLDVSFNVKTPTPRILSDGSKMWRIRLQSSTALGMQVYFNKFKLPFGASLYIFNHDKTDVLGAYTYLNNNRDPNKPIQFGTQWISGRMIYLEYVEPANPEFAGELELAKVAHIFEDVVPKNGPFGAAGVCQKNVVCPEGDSWKKERNTVALILAYSPSNKLFAMCSGAVINNTAQDGRPLFLSANHCVDVIRPGDPCYTPPYDPQNDIYFDHSTWLFLFNHQTKTCTSNGSDVSSSTVESVYGSLLFSSDGKCSPTSDYLLLELNTSKEQMTDMGVCYAGWSKASSPGTASFVGIHHPSGDVKKISMEYNLVQSTNYSSNTVTGTGSHWKVADWDLGATEGGSSGSPLFNSNHQIVGQLHGGASECNTSTDNGQPDWYGKFSTSWTQGGFAIWLDPNSSGQQDINTLNFPGCRDGILNGNETGVDCGGDCKPCSIVYPPGGGGTPPCDGVSFSINNKPTNNGQIVNVCKSNIILSPASYSGTTCVPGWLPTLVYTRSNRVPCNMYTPPGSPVFCKTDLKPNFWLGLPDGSCECKYLKLFISIQECNVDKVPIGSEIARWYDIPEYLGEFSLTNYVSSSFIQEGKYYKVKVGSSAKNVWREYTGYMKVYTDNLALQNETLTRDQFGRVISIQNSTVPAASAIKVVAKEEITLLPSSTFLAGSYYIADFDCNSINQFQVSASTLPMDNNHVMESSSAEENIITGMKSVENPSLTALAKDKVKVYPNPATDELNVELLIQNSQLISVNLYKLDGHMVKEIIKPSRFEKGYAATKIDCSDIPNGIYVVKVQMDNGTITEKVVILHQ